MKTATRHAVAALGIYAGLLGVEHGVFELARRPATPDRALINAIGPPCRPNAVWHACLPAMTIAPSYAVAGILTIIVSIAIVVSAVAVADRRPLWIVLALLGITMLLTGGGFVPSFITGIAAVTVAATQTYEKHRQTPTGRVLATLWPWTVVLLSIWFPAAWVLGYLVPNMMLRLGFAFFLMFDVGLPVLTALAAAAYDGKLNLSQVRRG